MILRARIVDAILAAATFVASLLLRLPLLAANPYGDEHLHFLTARDGTTASGFYTDVWGNPVHAPINLFWQRPAFYALEHFPANHSFETFRFVAMLASCAIAPAAFFLLRQQRFSRSTAALAATAIAVWPALVGWGSIAFMDAMMTLLLILFILAFNARQYAFAIVLGVLAAWTKEFAIVVIAIHLATTILWRIAKRKAVWPLSFSTGESALVVILGLGSLPILYALSQDLQLPGGENHIGVFPAIEASLGSAWFLPFIVYGLTQPASRNLAQWSLQALGFHIVLALLGRSVEAWYNIPTIVLGFIATAAALEAGWKRSRTTWHRVGTGAAITICLGLVLAGSFQGPLFDRLHPWSNAKHSDLQATQDYVLEIRDRELNDLFEAMELDGQTQVVLVTTGWPLPYVYLEKAAHVYVDFPQYRAVYGFGVEQLALRIEANSTRTLVQAVDLPIIKAIEETYSDCIERRSETYLLLNAESCAGRAAQLATANRNYGAPT